MGPPGGPIFGTVFRFIFWSFLYQGCRSATFWFQWSFVAYGDRKGNCSNSICLLLTKRSCQFLFVGLCCWFCDFAVSFLVPPDGPKNGTVKVVFFCSFTKLCMRSQKWDRQAVPFLGPCLGSFFEVFCIKVAEAQRFGFNEALWLMATGRATVPTLYACCLLNAVVSFCLSAFAVDFAILRSHFWYRQTVPKMGPWKWFSSVLLLSCACGPKNGTARRSHFWDRV